jgi:hypothetical protein
MNTFLIATAEELRGLTKAERDVYEMYRLEGMKKDAICEKLGITIDTFMCHWHRGMRKIARARDMAENPQSFMRKGTRGTDVLRGDGAATSTERQSYGNDAANIGLRPIMPDPILEDVPEDDEEKIDPKAIFDQAERTILGPMRRAAAPLPVPGISGPGARPAGHDPA